MFPHGLGGAGEFLDRLALVVGTGDDVVAGGDRLHLRVGELRPARLRQGVEGDAIEAVTGRADFLVDLEAAL